MSGVAKDTCVAATTRELREAEQVGGRRHLDVLDAMAAVAPAVDLRYRVAHCASAPCGCAVADGMQPRTQAVAVVAATVQFRSSCRTNWRAIAAADVKGSSMNAGLRTSTVPSIIPAKPWVNNSRAIASRRRTGSTSRSGVTFVSRAAPRDVVDGQAALGELARSTAERSLSVSRRRSRSVSDVRPG